MNQPELPRKLGLLDSSSIVVGTVIGSSIFLVPNLVARNLPSPAMIVAVWTFTGVLTFLGALALAELGAMMPSTGGVYVYLRESYGPLCGFLCGWTYFLVVLSGSDATLVVAFSIYLSYLVPLSPALAKLAAIGLLAVLTFISYRGVAAGAAAQNLFTFLKITGVAVLVGAAFLGPARSAEAWSASVSGFSLSHFGVAMIACLQAYDGWYYVSFVAGEVRAPRRNLPLSLGLGMAAVVAVYVLANLAYLRVLSIGEIAGSERVAAAAAERSMGPAGAGIVALAVLLSIVGAINGGRITVPRVYFAQARDGLFFKRFGAVHPRFETPSFSIVVSGIWTAVLTLSGTYEQLYSYLIFAAAIFHGMAVVGVIMLRRKYPDLPRPYKMWGYPVTPLLFAAISLWFVVNTIITTPGPSLAGLLLMASGVPAYYYWRRKAALAAGNP